MKLYFYSDAGVIFSIYQSDGLSFHFFIVLSLFSPPGRTRGSNAYLITQFYVFTVHLLPVCLKLVFS